MTPISFLCLTAWRRCAYTVLRLSAFAAFFFLFADISAAVTFSQTFVNPAAINIADNTTATPSYPSAINVSGVSGRVTRVVVTLNGFTHGRPDDVGVLLVGPFGQKILLMADVGGSTAVATPVNIPLDDRAAAYLADNAAITNAVSKPTLGLSGSGGDGNVHPANFPAPAPAGPYSVQLSDFAGTGANGTWSLYVDDDTAGSTGSIANGWTLTITTGGVFTNVGAITINDNAVASPYPSSINASGFTGSVTKVTLRLNGLNHTFLDDVGLLLVGPNGTAVHLTTDNGGSNNAVNLMLVFDDTAANALPDNAIWNSTTYKPTTDGADNGGSGPHAANFPAPAPAGPYPITLSSFNGSNPNGTWSLYVDDDTAADVGTVSGGWTLMIEASGTTAAQAGINGRVSNSAGRGIGKVRVTLSGGTLAEPVIALTNPFGYYGFEDLPAGQAYVIAIQSKRYHFTNPVRIVSLADNVTGMDFVSEP